MTFKKCTKCDKNTSRKDGVCNYCIVHKSKSSSIKLRKYHQRMAEHYTRPIVKLNNVEREMNPFELIAYVNELNPEAIYGKERFTTDEEIQEYLDYRYQCRREKIKSRRNSGNTQQHD